MLCDASFATHCLLVVCEGEGRVRGLVISLCLPFVTSQVDPSSPNILNLSYIGDDVLFKLRRPFLSELQTRFGNMFYVREQVCRWGMPLSASLGLNFRVKGCSPRLRIIITVFHEETNSF